MKSLPVLLTTVLLLACDGKVAIEKQALPSDSSTATIKSDSSSAATTTPTALPTGPVLYLLDSMTAMTQSIEKEQERDAFDLLPSARLENEIRSLVAGRAVRDTVIFHEACTDEDIHYRVYQNSVEVMSRTNDPMTVMVPRAALEHFGVTPGDRVDAVIKKLGSPRKVNDQIALYVTDQPDKSIREYMPNRWRLFILFSNGEADRIVMQRFQEDC